MQMGVTPVARTLSLRSEWKGSRSSPVRLPRLRAGTEGGPGGPAERQAGLHVRGQVLVARPSDSPFPASRLLGPSATVTPPVVPEVSCFPAR